MSQCLRNIPEKNCESNPYFLPSIEFTFKKLSICIRIKNFQIPLVSMLVESPFQDEKKKEDTQLETLIQNAAVLNSVYSIIAYFQLDNIHSPVTYRTCSWGIPLLNPADLDAPRLEHISKQKKKTRHGTIYISMVVTLFLVPAWTI